jgi:hypothetical protein
MKPWEGFTPLEDSVRSGRIPILESTILGGLEGHSAAKIISGRTPH